MQIKRLVEATSSGLIKTVNLCKFLHIVTNIIFIGF